MPHYSLDSWRQFGLRIIQNALKKTTTNTKGNEKNEKKSAKNLEYLDNEKLLSFQYLNGGLLASSMCILLAIVYCRNAAWYTSDVLWQARFWWSLALCYIIFACLNGQGGIVNWFLSQPRWQPLSRLSFNIYLIHYTVMSIFYDDQKVAPYNSLLTQVKITKYGFQCNAIEMFILTLFNMSNLHTFRCKNCF